MTDGQLEELYELREEVRQAQAVCDSYALENQQFSDKIDRLRTALEQIAAMKGGQGFLLSCPEIARRALEEK